MLDDLKMIHERDAQDVLGVIAGQWQQLASDPSLPASFRPHGITDVVFVGAGGPAVAARLARRWLDVVVPFEVIDDWQLPRYAGTGTLCIIAGTAGADAAVRDVLQTAVERGVQAVLIGDSTSAATATPGLPCVVLPSAPASRFAVWAAAKALAAICDAAGLTQGKAAEMAEQAGWFGAQLQGWGPEVATRHNEAKRIALELAGRSVVITAGPQLAAAAYRWKLSLNENAKHVAWWSCWPDAGPAEAAGWTRQPVNKPYAVIELRSDLERPQVVRYSDAAERVLSGLRPAPIVVRPQGDTLIRQMLYACGLGDSVSAYLALLGNINPADTAIADMINKEIS